MKYSNHIEKIAELSESEGVFTTAQAARMGIPRDALHDAVESGRLERVVRGAYRMVGFGSSLTDELAAIWKLTAPAKFSHERMRVADWDGIAVGGSTASALLGIGDLELSPYRLYAPRRINTRNPSGSFARRAVSRAEVTFESGLPVTRPERTVFDLVADDEDLSLVADVLGDASRKFPGFDYGKLRGLLEGRYGEELGYAVFEVLMEDSGLLGKGAKT
jgi:predicted transcriptional regulator of viral defense system